MDVLVNLRGDTVDDVPLDAIRPGGTVSTIKPVPRRRNHRLARAAPDAAPPTRMKGVTVRRPLRRRLRLALAAKAAGPASILARAILLAFSVPVAVTSRPSARATPTAAAAPSAAKPIEGATTEKGL
ncbi:hypothetical protein [Micromonospora sp. 050-3]|uniref:hypothetical protein n=1 Tax=Micromonospora sp. 050-3 TaxID=2789265 RepID=UPI003978805A